MTTFITFKSQLFKDNSKALSHLPNSRYCGIFTKTDFSFFKNFSAKSYL